MQQNTEENNPQNTEDEDQLDEMTGEEPETNSLPPRVVTLNGIATLVMAAATASVMPVVVQRSVATAQASWLSVIGEVFPANQERADGIERTEKVKIVEDEIKNVT
ncbi:hypothetical protein JOM56_012887 [Amanita muscaria]